MPPRKSKAGGGDDQCPMLKLVMEKGPLSGQTFEFRPGSLVRIGRLVRGNTLTIKDHGISSKHLLIQVQADPAGRGRFWTITDLESSNGTILNGEGLEESAALSDGDVIKLGELTSIKVEFGSNAVEKEVSSTNVRRNPRRGPRGRAAGLGVIDEISEVRLGNEEDVKEIDEVAEIEVKQGRNVSTKRTRNSKKNDSVLKDLSSAENKDFFVVDEFSELGLEDKEDVEEIAEVAEIEVKQGRSMSTKRTRNSKKNEGVSKDLYSDENNDFGVSGVSTRRTRNSRKEEDATKTVIDPSVIEGNLPKKRGGGRKKLLLSEKTQKEEEAKLESKTCEEEERGGAESGSTSGVKENKIDAGKGKMIADLENMTLGQWFEYLEVNLPQQIIDETEKMIAEMRWKAERTHEFMLQLKKGKGKT